MIIALFGRTIWKTENTLTGLIHFKMFCHLLDPLIPAKHKLLDVHASVPGDVEDQEDLADQRAVHLVGEEKAPRGNLHD